MMHLVLDGIWVHTEVFWWPFFGVSFGDVALPELSHGLPLTLLLEAIGAGALAWCWVTFDLGDPANRELFIRSGQLRRDVLQ
jgi:hypothetical protein